AEQPPSLRQRESRDVAAVDPDHVEDMIRRLAVPFDFTIEDHVGDGQCRNRGGDAGKRLLLSCTRVEAYDVALFEGDEANPVVFPLEGPLRAGEPFLCERGGHRLDPLRERETSRWTGAVGFGHAGEVTPRV